MIPHNCVIDLCSRSVSEKRFTFAVAVVLRMVLGHWVERYFQPFGHFSPLFWCRMMEEFGQIVRKLETDEHKIVPPLVFVSRFTVKSGVTIQT